MSRRRGRATKGDSSSSSKLKKGTSDENGAKKGSKNKGRSSLRTAQQGLNVAQVDPKETLKFFEFPEIRPPPPLLIEEAAKAPVEDHFNFESWSAGQIDGFRSEMDHIERVVLHLKGNVEAALKQLKSNSVKRASHVAVRLPAANVYTNKISPVAGGAASSSMPTALSAAMPPARAHASKSPKSAGARGRPLSSSRNNATGGELPPKQKVKRGRRASNNADDELFSEGDALDDEEEYDDDEYRARDDVAGESSSGSNSSRRNKRKKKKSSLGGGSLVSAEPPPPPKNSFWYFMQPFFAPITEKHFQLMQPTNIDTKKDPDFQMPPLGKHYLDQWSQEDGVQYKRKRGGEAMYIGENTQRLLAALVSENVNDSEVIHAGGGAGGTGRKSKKLEKGSKRTRSSSKLSSGDNPIACFNGELMKHIEQSVKQNLMSLDLIQQQTTSNQEDDEICETIRRLQSELRDQIRQNNELKANVLPMLRQRVVQQEQEQKARQEAANVLSRYKELMQRQIKKRKK